MSRDDFDCSGTQPLLEELDNSKVCLALLWWRGHFDLQPITVGSHNLRATRSGDHFELNVHPIRDTLYEFRLMLHTQFC